MRFDLDTAVIVLPFLFAIGVEVTPKNIKETWAWRVAIFLFGILVSGLVWLQQTQARREHAQELSLAASRNEQQNSYTRGQLDALIASNHDIFRMLVSASTTNNISKSQESPASDPFPASVPNEAVISEAETVVMQMEMAKMQYQSNVQAIKIPPESEGYRAFVEQARYNELAEATFTYNTARARAIPLLESMSYRLGTPLPRPLPSAFRDVKERKALNIRDVDAATSYLKNIAAMLRSHTS